MDFITIDYSVNDGLINSTPTTSLVGGDIVFNDDVSFGNTKTDTLTMGNPTGGVGGGYTFATILGPDGYVMSSDVASNDIVWQPSGIGAGDVHNGGDPGPVSVGTTDATNMTIISGGDIAIGSAGSGDQILLNGGVNFQYHNINTALGTLILDSQYFFIEITNAGTTVVELPDASTANGRQYIISKGFSSGTLTLSTSVSDTIDGQPTMTMTQLDQRIKVISNGDDKWLIL